MIGVDSKSHHLMSLHHRNHHLRVVDLLNQCITGRMATDHILRRVDLPPETGGQSKVEESGK